MCSFVCSYAFLFFNNYLRKKIKRFTSLFVILLRCAIYIFWLNFLSYGLSLHIPWFLKTHPSPSALLFLWSFLQLYLFSGSASSIFLFQLYNNQHSAFKLDYKNNLLGSNRFYYQDYKSQAKLDINRLPAASGNSPRCSCHIFRKIIYFTIKPWSESALTATYQFDITLSSNASRHHISFNSRWIRLQYTDREQFCLVCSFAEVAHVVSEI